MQQVSSNQSQLHPQQPTIYGKRASVAKSLWKPASSNLRNERSATCIACTSQHLMHFAFCAATGAVMCLAGSPNTTRLFKRVGAAHGHDSRAFCIRPVWHRIVFPTHRGSNYIEWKFSVCRSVMSRRWAYRVAEELSPGRAMKAFQALRGSLECFCLFELVRQSFLINLQNFDS